MSIQNCWSVALVTILMFGVRTELAAQVESFKKVVGRWDVTVHSSEQQTFPSWFEVQRSGRRTLVGSFVGQFGSARPIAEFHFNDGQLRFSVPPQWEQRSDNQLFEGRLDGEILRGETTNEKGKSLRWEARRAPTLKRDHSPQWSEPINLFNGTDLSGWERRNSGVPNGWEVKNGLLKNAKPGNDLLSTQTFTDFKLYAEFRYPRKSNSGIYLRGRYEVQIEDGYGDEPDSHKIGGVYGFLTPSVNAAKKADEWQTVDISLIGRVLSVKLNGARIIDRQTIPGITGGALDSNEGEPGPILLQGDHGPIEFRKLVVTPAI